MGRFFNALREASRSLPADANPLEMDLGLAEPAAPDRPEPPVANWEPDRPEPPVINWAPNRPDPPVANWAPIDEDAQMPEVPPLEVEQLFSASAATRNGSHGHKIDISLDRRARLLPHTNDSGVVEHYRRLRTKLMQQHATTPFRILLVTSPGPEEGKTVTVLNLALSFAMLDSFKVLVVDGDLRKGSLGKWLGVPGAPGFNNLIEGSATLDQVVLKSDEFPVHFMVRGTSEMPAAELLNSPQCGTQLRRIAEEFDLVLVDSPPVNLITDTQLLAANCDAILLVARAYSTTCKAFEKAVNDLSRFRIVGTVLNGAARHQIYRRYEGYY